MEPSFYDNEYLVIDEISYRFKEPVRGEIVVFRYPRDTRQFFIKRIIGLPGETIQITARNVAGFKAGKSLKDAVQDILTDDPGPSIIK